MFTRNGQPQHATMGAVRRQYPQPVETLPVEPEPEETNVREISTFNKFLLRAGFMTAKTSTTEPPRLNPVVIALGSLLIVAVSALVAIGIAWGNQNGKMSFLEYRLEQSEKTVEKLTNELNKTKQLQDLDNKDFERRIYQLEQKRR